MSNATKTLALAFVGSLALVGLVTWTGGSPASEAFRGTVIALDTADVAALVVQDPDEEAPVRLARAEGGWTVGRGEEGPRYPAEAASVRRALEALGALRASAVVTRQPEKHARFAVDSTGTTVTALDDDGDVLARLVVGRVSFASQQPRTYVRPADDPSVFEVEGMLASRLNRDLEAWREKRVWTLDRAALTRIDFAYPADSAFSIERAVGEAAWVSEGDTLQAGVVGQLVDELAALDAAGFAEDLDPEAFGTARYTLRLHLDGGEARELRLRPADGEEDTRYLVAASGYPYVFEVRKRTWDNRVLKARSALLREGDE